MDGIWLSDLNTLSLVHNSLDWAFPRSWSPCMWKLDQVSCPSELGFVSQWIPCWIVASVQAEGAGKLYMCLMLLIPANDSTSRVEVGGGGFKPNPPLSYPHLWFPVSVMLWLISIFSPSPRMLTGPQPTVLWPGLSATIQGHFRASKPFQEGSPSISIIHVLWASQWLSGKESACQCRKHGFNPWIVKIPWRREWQPIPVFLSGKSHGQSRLAGYHP